MTYVVMENICPYQSNKGENAHRYAVREEENRESDREIKKFNVTKSWGREGVRALHCVTGQNTRKYYKKRPTRKYYKKILEGKIYIKILHEKMTITLKCTTYRDNAYLKIVIFKC